MSSTVTSCPLEKSLCCPKPKKSCKVVECDPVDCCPTVPEVDPCACETAMDCCSLPYQRLDKLRNVYSTLASTSLKNEQYESTYNTTSTLSTFNSIFTRDGSNVTVPSENLFNNGAGTIVGFFPNQTADSTTLVPVVDGVNFSNAVSAYNFVQTMRYSMYRDVVCNAADQVIGWFVNPANRQLQVFQDLTSILSALGLTYTDTLQYYDSIASSSMTVQTKQKLASLNILFDLSLNAIRKVNLNPKTEGNIFNMCDRCGQKWMIVINTADVPTSSNYRAGANGYVIVASRV